MWNMTRKRIATILATMLLTTVFVVSGISCSVNDPLIDNLYTESIYPGITDTYDIGSATLRYDGGYFREIYLNGALLVPGVIIEADPVFTGSPSFAITAGDINGWNNHPALTTGTHGVGAGSIVGTTLVQELDNKTLDSSVGKGTWTASGVWKLPAMYFNGDITTDRWLSDESNTFLGTLIANAGNLAHTGGSEGYSNTAIGHHSIFAITTGSFNNAWGAHSLFNLTSGNGNVGVGVLSGNKITTGSYNVMIGDLAGPTANGDYGLFIDISETDTPLIGGNFNSNYVRIYDKLGIGVTPTAELHLAAGTATAGTAPLKLTSGTLLTTPEAGVLEYDGTGIYLTNTNHRRFISQASDSIVTPVSVASTTDLTTVFTAVLNANELKEHRVYRLSFYGEFSTHDAADTITVQVDVNGTTAVTLESTAGLVTDSPFHGECVFTVRSTGAGGSISAHGAMTLGTKMTRTNTSSIAVDTTAINNATLKVQWSAADAGNVFTLDQALLEVLD